MVACSDKKSLVHPEKDFTSTGTRQQSGLHFSWLGMMVATPHTSLKGRKQVTWRFFAGLLQNRARDEERTSTPWRCSCIVEIAFSLNLATPGRISAEFFSPSYP